MRSSFQIDSDKNQWSKREQDWYEIEEKLIFKNNSNNICDGDKQAIKDWIKAILKQKEHIKNKTNNTKNKNNEDNSINFHDS